ncbi:threonine-phosphate decarboxylase CobD [Mesobacillus selenatarsenatis]|uniref:threonine-phosphate decarboxylase n=1 Tax=Mesobacillus selenatarsenatis (strain DSM 18680 / JCM 14380 / FERM P-15431 / SF-1) TaxID=1321606 RepID=A0A0A8X238_MESS1|nr:threonine-phosphate decarboxylase CobD [Mesobacillus selenatarsenatis]GAM12201.1 L-threonine 3-O-phosphate decarboxylase [Mesobacillus selenatarsenatis SF-1]
MKWPSHGSNPHYLFEAMNLPFPSERVDFSANINPLGPPPIVKENWGSLFKVITEYPDPGGTVLKKKMAEQEGLQESQILLGNGGAEIISLLGRMLSGKKVVIVQPAFSEYEEACRVNGCQVEYHQLQPDSWDWIGDGLCEKLAGADAVFLCNPNNPTGVYYPKTMVLQLLEECRKHKCLLIVDEAFYDFLAEYESIAQYINEYPNLIIIRSMTKMFAIPGLRLGYLLADPSVIKSLGSFQPHWSINAIALKAGEWCLDCETYISETITFIEMERQRLFQFYKERNLQVSPSRINFYLLKDPSMEDQLPFLKYLVTRGMIPRHTVNFPGLEGRWLRFAIKGRSDNDKLMGAVDEWLNSRL